MAPVALDVRGIAPDRVLHCLPAAPMTCGDRARATATYRGCWMLPLPLESPSASTSLPTPHAHLRSVRGRPSSLAALPRALPLVLPLAVLSRTLPLVLPLAVFSCEYREGVRLSSSIPTCRGHPRGHDMTTGAIPEAQLAMSACASWTAQMAPHDMRHALPCVQASPACQRSPGGREPTWRTLSMSGG